MGQRSYFSSLPENSTLSSGKKKEKMDCTMNTNFYGHAIIVVGVYRAKSPAGGKIINVTFKRAGMSSIYSKV